MRLAATAMHPRNLSPSNGQAMGTINIAINSVFLGLAAVAVGIRIWSRRIQRHVLALNDYAVILAWVCKRQDTLT